MAKRRRERIGSDDELLLEMHPPPGFAARTLYDRTVTNLRAIFSESELYFGLYETMHD